MAIGRIFNIERFATKDGPGIRTLVFLKGCPLKCIWCANPESQRYDKEIMYYPNKCVKCGHCIESCPHHAIKLDEVFGLLIDKEKCNVCGICVRNCYYGAREIMGKDIEAKELFKELIKDFPYFLESGGGVTFSGGEPTLQVDFVVEVAELLKTKNIHLAIETCGYTPWEVLKRIAKMFDLIFFDIKHIDPVVHKKLTGVSNELILENLRKLDTIFKNIIVRIPVIPDCNDSLETQRDIFSFLSTLKNIQAVELLPYHRLGVFKYQGLGRDYQLKEKKALSPDDLKPIKALGSKFGLKIRIGTI